MIEISAIISLVLIEVLCISQLLSTSICICQDYDAMIELVEALPDHDQILKAPVQYQYAFALNRRNSPGYRNKALAILEEVSEV